MDAQIHESQNKKNNQKDRVKKRVLITDSSQRKSIPIIRSLGRKGIDVVAAEDSSLSMGFFSKYTTSSIIYPAPENEEIFISWLIHKANSGVFDILFPIDERTMEPVTRNLSRLKKHMAVPVVDFEKFMQARDKSKTYKLADSLGISIPRTITPNSLDAINESLKDATCPAVVKPRSGSGSRGVKYCFTKEELYPTYIEVHKDYKLPLVQEYVPHGGDTFGVEFLCNKGEVLRTFVHRRLREFPLKGGPSTLRESIHREDLVEDAKKLLMSIGWHGVAMVEFKENPNTGECVLMEINPKFWGSVALPISAGVDFPYLLYQMACEEEIGKDPGYDANVMCRWLLPGDILHFFANPDRFKLKPSFFQFRGMHYDIVDISDMGPIFGMGLSFMKSIIDPDFWRNKIFR